MNTGIVRTFETDSLAQGINRWVIWDPAPLTDWRESISLNDYFNDWVVEIGKIRALWKDMVIELLVKTYWVAIERILARVTGEKLIDPSALVENVVLAYTVIMESSWETMSMKEYNSRISLT